MPIDSTKLLLGSLYAIAFFSTAIVMVLLYSKKRQSAPGNGFLGLYFMGMAVAMMMNYLIHMQLILSVPWLYRLPSPLYYAMFPAAYLYVRRILTDNPKFKWYDALHFLPAFIHLVEMFPYYMLPQNIKLQHILEDQKNPLGGLSHSEGVLPNYLHNIFRGISGTVYGCCALYLMRSMKKKRPRIAEINTEVWHWLRFFLFTMIIFSLSLLVFLWLPNIAPAYWRSLWLFSIMAITQIAACLNFLLRPNILIGFPRFSYQLASTLLPESVNNSELVQVVTDKVSRNLEEIDEKADVIILRLNNLMLERQLFLQPKLSVQEVATALQVQQHHLSYILNTNLGLRFNDYINRLRVDHLKARMEKEDLTHFTMEALAKEAGFSSRVTFIRAVQKYTGQQPSSYFSNAARRELI